MKNHQQWTIIHTHSSSRHLKRLPPHFGTRQIRSQRLQKDICITQKQVSLERDEEISTPTLHELPSMCKTQHQNTPAEE